MITKDVQHSGDPAPWSPDEDLPCAICGKMNHDLSFRNAARNCVRICAECGFKAMFAGCGLFAFLLAIQGGKEVCGKAWQK